MDVVDRVTNKLITTLLLRCYELQNILCQIMEYIMKCELQNMSATMKYTICKIHAFFVTAKKHKAYDVRFYQ